MSIMEPVWMTGLLFRTLVQVSHIWVHNFTII